jgi:selenocysteine-specific elongation factor
MRHLILGTAGHVDHGKTELVRALTGHDTDRLKEEKERGISIELGFAPLPLDEGTFLGVVDVPGHERFVKHMVAGAGGIDLAMLLIAADEGVMPQTREHMEVLRSLEVPGGLIVVSKCDLASGDMLEILGEEITELTRGTFLEGAPVIETSARTGQGIGELKSALRELALRVPVRETSGPFRQPVDRVFHKKGIGVVVTGSCCSGSVRVGDQLELLPRGLSTRVREIQSFNERRTEGRAGERLAIALHGLKLEEVSRGDTLASPSRFHVSTAIDARIRLSTYWDFEVKNRERVRIHHGAHEVLGRVILLEADHLSAGESALVQLLLESPLVPAEGDRFVLRKYSPTRVIGGGTVIDPRPERHRRRDAGALDELRLREQGDPADVILKSVEGAWLHGVAAGDVDASLLGALVKDGRVVEVDGVVFHRSALDALAQDAEDLTAAHQARFPLQWGLDKEELRQKTQFPHGPSVFNRVLEVLGTIRPLFVKGNRVRSGVPQVKLPEDARNELTALAALIREAGAAFPDRSDLEREWKSGYRLSDALQYLRDAGEIVDVGEGGVIHRDAMGRCVQALRELFVTRREISVPEVKDALGLTRKHVIPLLELLDAQRVTLRTGNNRVKGPNFPEGGGSEPRPRRP